MWGAGLIGEPDDPELNEIVVRYAARCRRREDAQKVFTESVPLYNNGPAGASGIGTRPPIKELFGLWSSLIPREQVPVAVDLVEA
jgi:hypothetical protein